jgi:DNA-binding transcriptional regulator YdaS (Cro superfamily)
MRNIKEVIDALGGYIKVAARIGINKNTVNAWRGRNSMPAKYDKIIVRMAADLSVDITPELLSDIRYFKEGSR